MDICPCVCACVCVCVHARVCASVCVCVDREQNVRNHMCVVPGQGWILFPILSMESWGKGEADREEEEEKDYSFYKLEDLGRLGPLCLFK